MNIKYRVMYGFIDQFNSLRYAQEGRAVSLATAKRLAEQHNHTAYVVKLGSNIPEFISEK